MIDDFQKNMTLIAGGNDPQAQEKQLSAEDKKKISDAYFKLYYSLTFAGCMRGMTLGQAWFKALEQVKSYISAKNANNPAALYMKQIYAAHNARWSKLIMTSPNKDVKITCPPEKQAAWNSRIAQDTNSALGVLNTTLAAHQAKIQPQVQNNQAAFMSAHQKMQMMLQLQIQQMQQNQRGGMAA